MARYRELVVKAMEKGAEEEAWELADEAMEKLHRKWPDLYDELMSDLECLAYKISPEEAMQIVKSMRPKGQYWSMQQVKDVCREHGIDKDVVNWYLVLNMVYNDNYRTAKTFGLQDDEEFYWSLAKDFIEDPDAKPYKVERYFCD